MSEKQQIRIHIAAGDEETFGEHETNALDSLLEDLTRRDLKVVEVLINGESLNQTDRGVEIWAEANGIKRRRLKFDDGHLPGKLIGKRNLTRAIVQAVNAVVILPGAEKALSEARRDGKPVFRFRPKQ